MDSATREEMIQAVKNVGIRLHNLSAEAPIGSKERRDLIMKAVGAFEALKAIDTTYAPTPEAILSREAANP